MRKLMVTVLSVWVIITAALLLMGHEVLIQPGPYGVPMGNLLTWTALVAFPAAQLLGLYHKKNRENDLRINIFWIGAWASMVVSALWGLLSYGLSGNWYFTFSQNAPDFVGGPEAAVFFMYLTIATALLPLFVLLLYLIYRSL